MKIISFLLSFCFSITVIAQAEWAPVGAKWWYGGMSHPDSIRTMMYEVEKDTVFQGQPCRKIRGIITYRDKSREQTEPYYTYRQNDSVFFYSDFWKSFVLMYDFSAQVGDTVTYKTFLDPGTSDSTYRLVVQNIELRTYCSDTMKTWIFENGFSPHYEKIGTDHGLLHFEYLVFVPEAILQLRCFTQDGGEGQLCLQWDPDFPTDCEGRLVGVEGKKHQPDLYIAPNPVKAGQTINLIFNNTPSDNLRYELWDTMGRKYRAGQFAAPAVHLSTDGIPPGVYFIFLKINNRMAASQKIILQ